MRRLLLLLALVANTAAADGFRKLEGHGGPIMGAASTAGLVATASFDNAIGLWTDFQGPPRWLDGHEAAVKAIAFVGSDLIATGGDDNLIILWNRSTGAVVRRLSGHKSKIMALAASPDGKLIASASWDWRIGLWDTSTGKLVRWIEGHTSNVNDVAFGADGYLYSASTDGTVREWRWADATQTRILARHGFGVNRLVVDAEATWVAYGGLDGGTRVVGLAEGKELADLTLDRRPILALTRRPDGKEIAVGDGEGHIMVVSTDDWSITRDFRAARRGPIWALAYVDNGTALLAGGIEDEAYVFPISQASSNGPQLGKTKRAFHVDPKKVSNGERQFLRKCSVCHSLTPDSGRKAGPTLYGVFGRRAGVVPGYIYSDALNGAELVWTDATIDKLFELGPDHYTPGSKMPMQQIARPQDRADLIAFLKEATKP